MKKRLLVVLSIICSMLSVTTVFAEPNLIHVRWIDTGNFVDYTMCAFPIVVSSSANITDLIFFNEDGKEVRLLSTVNHAEITFTANGKSLTARGSGGINYEANPDGTVTAQTFGINLLLTVPGYGSVFLDTGRAEFLFDHGLHEIFHAGPASYDMAAFCGALS